MTERKPVESWLTDMDGVLVHEGQPVPGAPEFVGRLRISGKPFLILTNNSIYTARDLQARLARMGIEVSERNIWTSALATAQFLSDQRPGGTAYVIGEAGLTTALHDVGYVLTDHEPDYVVLGEDPDVQLRSHYPGHPAHQQRRAVHRDEPGSDRPVI
jgi:NagD protein